MPAIHALLCHVIVCQYMFCNQCCILGTFTAVNVEANLPGTSISLMILIDMKIISFWCVLLGSDSGELQTNGSQKRQRKKRRQMKKKNQVCIAIQNIPGTILLVLAMAIQAKRSEIWLVKITNFGSRKMQFIWF